MMHMTPAAAPRPWLFPIVVLAPSVAAALLIARGAPPAVAMTAAVVGLIVALTAAELRWPFERAWRPRCDRESWTDLVYTAFASVPDRLTRVGVEAGAVALAGAAVATDAGPITPSTIARAVLAFALADLGKYLIHRASHTWGWLWPFHLAHHQPARLSATNALRLHPINLAYNAAIDVVPVLVLGVPPAVAAVLATLRATVGVVQHANLSLERGRQWLVNAPSAHRLHHAVDVDVANHNFASTLLVWDRLLGTLARGPAPAQLGVPSPGHHLPTGFLGQLLYPLCGPRLATTCVFARVRTLVR